MYAKTETMILEGFPIGPFYYFCGELNIDPLCNDGECDFCPHKLTDQVRSHCCMSRNCVISLCDCVQIVYFFFTYNYVCACVFSHLSQTVINRNLVMGLDCLNNNVKNQIYFSLVPEICNAFEWGVMPFRRKTRDKYVSPI